MHVGILGDWKFRKEDMADFEPKRLTKSCAVNSLDESGVCVCVNSDALRIVYNISFSVDFQCLIKTMILFSHLDQMRSLIQLTLKTKDKMNASPQ